MTQTVLVTNRPATKANEQVIWFDKLAWFCLAVLGFSFWFFIAVPFATHRESYEWLAAVRTHGFSEAFAFISVTYRPFAQGVTWLGFKILDPNEFPTSVVRQTLLQCIVYSLFLCAWWLIFSAAKQRRTFAIVALFVGAMYFPGYVHLFHIYGLFYVPVMLMVGAVLLFDSQGAPGKYESWLGISAILMVFWHPFATAIFVGYYFGLYLATFQTRERGEHGRAWLLLGGSLVAIYLTVVAFPRADVKTPIATKLYGGLVTYQTSEINLFASFISLILAAMVVVSLSSSVRTKTVLLISLLIIGSGLMLNHQPVVLLWIGTALLKLGLMRRWSLFFATLAAALLPIGAVIGTPVFGLFAIIFATYTTCLEWRSAEQILAAVPVQYAFLPVASAAILIIILRAGVTIPGLTRAATPLLQERERTYQLEQALEWLHQSKYCSYGLDFADKSGSPIDSVENVITRRYRPPAGIEDVQMFWNDVLRCGGGARTSERSNQVIVTFRGPEMNGYEPVFTVKGKYAGDATVWIEATNGESVRPVALEPRK